MAVTVLQRPQAFKLINVPLTATVTNSGGDALVTFPSHGLSDNSTVYIRSNVEDYNGFSRVDVINANSFKLYRYTDTDHNAYRGNATITYYQTQAHAWMSVFLPITYRLSSNLWPTNSVDTARTVSSFTNDSEYVNLNLSGVLKTGVQDLDYVKIAGAANPDLNGIWQVINAISDSDVTVNIPYQSGYSFSGATVQFYYNNYAIKVKVFGGLNAGHPLQAIKPYEEITTVDLIPDENGEVFFSIHQILQDQIRIHNNLTKGYLPNNLDAFTQFYISVAETYDDSDGEEVVTLTTAYTSDQSNFEGAAMNSKLPFKNLYAGWMSLYTYTSGNPGKWLTLFDEPKFPAGYYSDITFIKPISGAFSIQLQKYMGDTISETEVVPYDDLGIGVYRIPVEMSEAYDRMCVKAFVPGTSGPSVAALDTWTSDPGEVVALAALPDWTTSAWSWNAGEGIWESCANGNGGTTGILEGAFNGLAGNVYGFSMSYELYSSPGSTDFSILFQVLDAANNVLYSRNQSRTSSMANDWTDTFSTPALSANAAKVRINITNNTEIDSRCFAIRDVTLTSGASAIYAWTTGANPSVNIATSAGISSRIKGAFAAQQGVLYTFDYDIDVSAGPVEIRFELLSGSTVRATDSFPFEAGSHSGSVMLQASGGSANLVAVTVIDNNSGGASVVDIDSFVAEGGDSAAFDLTETLCIKLYPECPEDSGEQPDESDYRITEDGVLRITETGDLRILE